MNRESTPARAPVLIYDRIAANKRSTFFLMFTFVVLTTALAGVIIFAVGGNIGVLGVVGIALIIYAIFSYFAATSIVLSISGAREEIGRAHV